MLYPSGSENEQARKLLDLVNAERTRNHTVALTEIRTLRVAAWTMMEEMHRRGYRKGHQDTQSRWPDERAKRAGYGRSSAKVIITENLAYDLHSPSKVFSDWMDNPEYRENLLNESFRATGLACHGGRWVQMFGSELNPRIDVAV